jgi:plasmid stabilization system protein ParE
MPAETVWLDQALDDLDSILDYISNDSPKAALRYGADLEKSCQRLRDFPMSGGAYKAGHRCLVFRNHLVFHRYDPAANTVSITMIIDARRDVDRILGQ